GRSLSTLGEHYGLSTDEMIGVGDANNDLELVRSAGLGIAVANATDDLKAVADEVAEKSNNEAAVADIVERWLLS
ncbi:MAG: HAD hydrolase family protein, partial [Planctomycetes bacterium]|nr:HAD hydrolase family protein [Planctomycetota bacterium]